MPPSRTGTNGYRFYDQAALVRLQRILLLRELGLGLPAIADVLDGERDTAVALRTHLRAQAFTGLGEMYVADPRFAQNYDRHGQGGAAFVRDAMKVYSEHNLT